ncbi:MAG TPA: DUF1552 domain-containing protein [Polyangiaceae bacterium]|nr:DUF1552 domain-containing protein [Polyangiaceae bacterium]
MVDFNRRIFLRGLGGAVVAAPFLGSLFERSARANTAPKRTIVMFTPNGCITNKWFPAKLDGELTAADLMPTSLAPLAPFSKKLLLPRGIRSMNEWTAANNGAGKGRGQGNDVHTQVMAAAFTCQPVSPNSNDPFSFNSATKFNAMPIGPSLDHVLAQQLSPTGDPLLLNVAGQTRTSPPNTISYSAANTIFSPVSAQQAFSQLTGLLNPAVPNADTWALVKGKRIADIVKDDLSRLSRRDMSKADKDKLGAWLQLINETAEMFGPLQCTQEVALKVGASTPIAGGSQDDDSDAVTRKAGASMDNADVHSAIAVLTAACNANPVIFLQYPGGFVYKGLGIDVDSSGLAQRVGNASMTGPCLQNVIADLLKIDGYYAQKFAFLVAMLDSIPEADGTLLDNSIAVWMNEFSDGCAHNLNNMPIIQAGSGGGYFRTGRIIHLDEASNATPEAMLGRSLAQCPDDSAGTADGVNQETGTDPKFGNAPVNKYFCNIMNAMGLKADAAGFPALDGPASEVTHFGYSDRTTDFCGGAGAIADAQIHDPGGFNALEA